MKRKVFKDVDTGKVVHIGDWDYGIEVQRAPEFDAAGKATGRMVRTEVPRNPKPDRFIETEAEVVEAIDGGLYDQADHAALRRTEYPSIADQLDALWKGGEAAEAMRQRVLAVKAKYQKVAK